MAKKNKNKKATREERKAARKREDEQDEAAQALMEARRHKYRIAAIVVPLVTVAAALGVYFATDSKQLAGLTGMFGIAVFVPLLLGAVGSEVTPRDRVRAGAIDFGASNDKRK